MTPDQYQWLSDAGIVGLVFFFVLGLKQRWWVMGYQLADAEERCQREAARADREAERVEKWQVFSLETVRAVTRSSMAAEQSAAIADRAIKLVSDQQQGSHHT